MRRSDRGKGFLEELRAFLSFLQSLWGILTGMSVLFPLSNVLFKVIPLKPFDQEGPFLYLSPPLLTAIATLVTLFVVLSTFSTRHEHPRIRVRRRSWVSFIVAALALVAYLVVYEVKRGIYGIAGWESDDLRHLILEVPLLALYSAFFSLMTRAFMLLGLLEFYREAGE